MALAKQKTTIEQLARLIRYYILVSTTEAGSGHPTSSLSAADLMATLFFGGFLKADLAAPENPANDRVLFSKGHAAPLLYAVYAAAGKVSEADMKTLRQFHSTLEGHPTKAFPYTETATGSLGQGLSVGLGMALNAKLDKLPYTTYVLLGDSEMAEGSVWEAIQVAAHYKLDNLVGIIDVNRLGQRGETMYGHDVKAYKKRVEAFGWKTITIDGHDISHITDAFKGAQTTKGKPVMIIAKTVKGKGVPFLEDKEGWHGKALSTDDLQKAFKELGPVDISFRGTPIQSRSKGTKTSESAPRSAKNPSYKIGELVATRKAYGNALVKLYPQFPNMVVLDAEVSNSTFAETFQKKYPKRFFEMYIAEQNMVGTALGLALRGKNVFVSTFAAFFTRAFDQIRMSQYSETDVTFVGSHAGVSIGEDGASQMGLEDIAMFRTILKGAVLYPSDAMATEKLVEQAALYKGIVYIRTTRKDTPVLYKPSEQFVVGGSKTLKKSPRDAITVCAAGITLHETLTAAEALKKEGVAIRVIDLYSIKPLDIATLKKAAQETKAIVTVEDHYAEGGLGEAVMDAVAESKIPVYSLAVRRMPKSGTPEELLAYENISRDAIVKMVKKLT